MKKYATDCKVWEKIKTPVNGPLNASAISGEAKYPWYWVKTIKGTYGIALRTPEAFRPVWDAIPKSVKMKLASVESSNSKEFFAGVTITEYALAPVFFELCNDLINSCEAATKIEQVFEFLVSRISSWSKLFKGQPGILSDEKALGLLAELTFLKDWWLKEGEARSLTDWKGPLKSPQDFISDDQKLAVEIKVHGVDDRKVKINSIDQLAYDGDEYLCAYEGFPSQDGEGSSLPEVIEDVKEYLDPIRWHEFDELLLKVGYVPDPLYNSKFYILRNMMTYEIKDGFPRLTKQNLPIAIEAAVYSVDLNHASDCVVELPKS